MGAGDSGWLEVSADPAYANMMAYRREVVQQQRDLAIVEDEASRGAQLELLTLVVEHLSMQLPERFAVVGEGEEQRVQSLAEGLEWRLADYADRPLELVGSLIQEDVCIMREEVQADGTYRHIFVAGVVMDSFDPVAKHMLPMLELHDPVPQYAPDLHESMGRVFATLRKPVWRANFSVAEWQGQEDTVDPSTETLLERLYLKVEYETLRRLSNNNKYLVFTIRAHMDPIISLASVPLAAAALAEDLQTLPEALLEYRGIGEGTSRQAVLSFLDSVCAAA